MFYTLLVLPYEWKKNEIGNFNKLDLSGPENVASAKATVKTDTYPNTDQALRHFRNALSHGRIDWSANGELVMKNRDASYGHSYTRQLFDDGPRRTCTEPQHGDSKLHSNSDHGAAGVSLSCLLQVTLPDPSRHWLRLRNPSKNDRFCPLGYCHHIGFECSIFAPIQNLNNVKGYISSLIAAKRRLGYFESVETLLYCKRTGYIF